jgi:glycosyltransferase involved in cell wall biosynthesis
MNDKVQVLMIHRIFASYRKPIYDKLAQHFNYLLLHGKNDTTIDQVVTDYSREIKLFQYAKNSTSIIFQNFSHLFTFKPEVVIHESSIGILSLLPTYLLCKLRGAKFILYGHGYNRFNNFQPEKSWADKYRVWLMKLSDAIIIYTNTDKNRLSKYIHHNKIFVAQNTLDTSHLVPIKTSLKEEGKEKLKQRLGFTHPYNLIFIGRLLDEKMPDKILEVFDILNKKMPDQIGIHYVGGGNTKVLKQIVKEKQWEAHVKFYGAVYDDTKTGEYLFASDLMIMPGYLGLAVNHAFAFDCPVISFKQTEKGPFHSPEIEYVVDHETGFLIPELSVEKMADKIVSYFHDSALQAYMQSKIKEKIEKDLTTDKMVKGFTDAVYFVLNKNSEKY